jgi:hypothetical protein
MGVQIAADPATGLAAPLSDAAIFNAASGLLPGSAMPMHLRLDRYDAYWYAHHEPQPVPVLRVGFDDPQHSWFHIDPHTGAVINLVDSSRRTYRWLFNALHSLDFSLLLMHRPAWDLVMWSLSLLGMIISVSGMVIGWRYLKK